MRGLDVGEVRPPLTEPTEDHVKQLAQLIERGYALIEPEIDSEIEIESQVASRIEEGA
jgi:5-dehydro-4-deoxyglucarate dehydratase